MMAKRFIYVSEWAVLISFCSGPRWAEASHIFNVVIDPGHGGIDEGAVYRSSGRKLAEKDITLQVAKKVAERLRNRGVQVTLTRTSDTEITLPSRTALANRLKADLFLSIHLNSTGNPDRMKEAEGVETFILNNTTDATSKRLAYLENRGLGTLPQVTTDTPQAFTGGMDVALILKDLQLDANLAGSKLLACSLQDQMLATTSAVMGNAAARSRGVKQSLFHVLLGADMPSALIEIGFLSSPHDRMLLTSLQGQELMSSAINRAIDVYQRDRNSPLAHLILSRCKIH